MGAEKIAEEGVVVNGYKVGDSLGLVCTHYGGDYDGENRFMPFTEERIIGKKRGELEELIRTNTKILSEDGRYVMCFDINWNKVVAALDNEKILVVEKTLDFCRKVLMALLSEGEKTA